MFSMPGQHSGEAVTVSESAQELQIFLAAISNDEDVWETTLKSMNDAKWLALARSSNKYFSIAARRTVQKHALQRIVAGDHNKKDTRLCFENAATLDDYDLLNMIGARPAWLYSVDIGTLRVTDAWKRKLTAQKARRGTHILNRLRYFEKGLPSHDWHACNNPEGFKLTSSNSGSCRGEGVAAKLISLAVSEFDVNATAPLPLADSVDSLNACCGAYKVVLRRKAVDFERSIVPSFDPEDDCM
ncbi:hypothetical protein JCM3766R1_003726 [Sporobolomyces carnicolor]